MLVPHYFGLPQPMSAVRAFCTARGIDLIEDCAHAFFGVSDGAPVGSWGDVAIASLTKFFPVPEGGLIVSGTRPLSDLRLAPRSWYGHVKAAFDAVELGARFGRFPGVNPLLDAFFGLKNWIRHRERDPVGAPNAGTDDYRRATRLLSASQPALAARWIASSVHQSRIVTLRRRNYAHLARLLADLPGTRVLQSELPDMATPYVFPLYVNDPAASYMRLRALAIPIFRWDEVWPDTPDLPGDYGIDWTTHVYQLGCHQDLRPEDIEGIAAIVRNTILKR